MTTQSPSPEAAPKPKTTRWYILGFVLLVAVVAFALDPCTEVVEPSQPVPSEP